MMTSELARIEQSYPLPSSYERCVGFFFQALRPLAPALPNVARDALVTAESYWLKGDREAPLLSAKTKVWREVDRLKGGGEGRTESILRCVLFVLDPAPATRDVHELLGWFADFVTRAGVPEVETLRVLKASFPAAG
jgi:hypothetical protein